MDFMEWQKAKQIETHNFTVNSFFGWYYVLFPPLLQTFDTCFDKIIRNIHIFSVSYSNYHLINPTLNLNTNDTYSLTFNNRF